VNLFTEQFQRGSDALGPEGWHLLASALRTVAGAFTAAALTCELVSGPVEGLHIHVTREEWLREHAQVLGPATHRKEQMEDEIFEELDA
jgi:hypothetical protein